LHTPKIRVCACGLVVTVLGLGFSSYFIRELLVSLALFSVAFLSLALTILAAILVWWASEQLANRSGRASRKVMAFSRRLIATYARS
jgi:peptidoglycan/LPS O-acetylase OafA/YrhL